MSEDDKAFVDSLKRAADQFCIALDSNPRLSLKWRADCLQEVESIVEHSEMLLSVADEAHGIQRKRERA